MAQHQVQVGGAALGLRLFVAALLGDAGFEVVLSSTRAEAIECAHYAYTRQADKPLVHIFEGAYAGSEVGRVVVPGAKAKPASALAPFAYTGPASPDTVLVLPNGSLSLAARALLVSLSASLRGKVGVVSVRQLYPWNASELVRALPSSVRTVRVVEEAYAALGGALYAHVLESWLGGAFGARSVDVQSLVLSAGELLSPEEWHALLSAAASSPAPLSLAQIRAERTDAALVDLLSLSSAQLVTFVGGDKGATVAAARLLAELSRPVLYGANRLAVTISIGGALYPQHAQQFAGLYKSADEAMYRAKEKGRSGFVLQGCDGELSPQACLMLDVLKVPSGLG